MISSMYGFLRSFIFSDEELSPLDAYTTADVINSIPSFKKDTTIESLKAIGLVTFFQEDNDNCIISNTFRFSKKKFYRYFTNRITLDSEVLFEAERTECSSWIVTSVQLHEDTTEDKDERRVLKDIAQVEYYDRHRKEITLRMGSLDKRTVKSDLLDFIPCSGDYLRIHAKLNGIEVLEGKYDDCQSRHIGEIFYATPTKQKTLNSTVITKNNFLCIDGTIYFENRVSDRPLRVGDAVTVTAVESYQEPFSWRAISIKTLTKVPLQQKQRMVDDGWSNAEESLPIPAHLDPLFEPRYELSIYPQKFVTFKDTRVEESSEQTITIKLMSDEPCLLKNVKVVGDQEICNFTVKLGNSKDTVCDNIKLTKSLSLVQITVLCYPRMIGRTKDLLLLEFESFTCGRYLMINSLPARNDPLEKYSTDMERPATRYAKYNQRQILNNIQRDCTERAIRGPQPFRQPFFQNRKLGFYAIPEDLQCAMTDKDENIMRKNYSYSKAKLDFNNYQKKFDLCLWLEEISTTFSLRKHIITLVMRQAGESMVLPIPNLQIVYPQIHTGDRVNVYFPNGLKEVRYEGNIYEVRGDNVYARFDPGFHVLYNRETVRIELVASRALFRRNHFAVESAVIGLGRSFLFPTENDVVMKPARICFEELTMADETSNSESNVVLKNPGRVMDLPSPTISSLKSLWGTRAESLRDVPVQNEITWKPNGMILKWRNTKLNIEQKEAVKRILRGQARPLPYFIFGPPGTGKTVTIVEAIVQVFSLEPNSRILVTAPSNSAADLIAHKLLETGCFVPGDFIRLLGFIRAEKENYSKELKAFVRTGDELHIVTKHRIVISTCATTSQFTQIKLDEGYFTHLFIDEAGYCTEPEAMLPCILVTVAKGGQVILAGDPYQLGAVLSSNYAVACGLQLSFLERLMKLPVYSRNVELFPTTNYNPVLLTKLVKNYRAHSALLKVPSKLFYDDELEPCADLTKYELCGKEEFLKEKLLVNLNVPIVFHGIQAASGRAINSTSWFNNYEASVVVHYVRKLLSLGVHVEDIGVITPYRGQVERIKRLYTNMLSEHQELGYDGPKVGSVEEFQGGERKIIIFTTVRSDNEKEGSSNKFQFVLNSKRFNVSITRAQSLLYVIGNPNLLTTDPNWCEFIQYCVDIGAYTGCDLPSIIHRNNDSVPASKKD